MLSAGEVARGLQGALGFLQRDPAAPSYFENTAESCLRSFQVMILVAPLYAVVLAILYSNVTTTADGWEIVAVEALRYTVDWLLFPVIFFEIARRQNWVGQYPRYISALNWVNLPLMVVAVVAVVLASILSTAAAILIQLGLYGLLFYWFLAVTRSVLNASWVQSFMLLLVNWVPSRFLSVIVDRFLGIAPAIGA